MSLIPLKLDDITAKPDFSGPSGRAWLCNHGNLQEQEGDEGGPDATVGMWLIEAPEAHPLWHSYVLVLVHLRTLPGREEEEVTFHLDGATHQLLLNALDPKGSRQSLVDCDLKAKNKCAILHPLNFAAQFIEITDNLARERCVSAVQAICDGKISPDTDYMWQWLGLFGNNMLKPEYRDSIWVR